MNTHIEEYIDKYLNDFTIEEKINEIKKSIKHPHLYYAVWDMDNDYVIYKKKKWYKRISGKRIILCKPIKFNIDMPKYTRLEK